MSTKLIEPSYGLSIAHFLTHLIPWQFKVCGPGFRHDALVAHLKREFVEVERASTLPHIQEELVDVVILSLEGSWRALMGPEHDALKSSSIAAMIEDVVLDELLDMAGRVAYTRLPYTTYLRENLEVVSGYKSFLAITCEALIQLLLLAQAAGAERPWVAVRGQLYAKFNRNIARTWPDWRAVPAGTPIEHVDGE